MLALLKKSNLVYVRNNYNLMKIFNKVQLVNYTKTKMKKEIYSYKQIEEIVGNLMEEEHRNIQNLPEEFQKYSENLIYIEKPVEPEAYECCGTIIK